MSFLSFADMQPDFNEYLDVHWFDPKAGTLRVRHRVFYNAHGYLELSDGWKLFKKLSKGFWRYHVKGSVGEDS